MNDKLIKDFYNKSTPEEKCQLLWILSRDIIIPAQKTDDYGNRYVDCMALDDELPVVLNGTAYQLNLEGFYEEERKAEKAMESDKKVDMRYHKSLEDETEWESNKWKNYHGLESLTYDEYCTIGNCQELGYGTKKVVAIIKDMRDRGIVYLNSGELEAYR